MDENGEIIGIKVNTSRPFSPYEENDNSYVTTTSTTTTTITTTTTTTTTYRHGFHVKDKSLKKIRFFVLQTIFLLLKS